MELFHPWRRSWTDRRCGNHDRKIKTDRRTYLCDWDMDPFLGLLHMIHAHNTLDRVGGHAPCQWAYGRFPTFDGRLFDSGLNVP